MSRSDVVVIDYGMGNLLSVARGLEYCGASVRVTSNADEILSAPRVVLPGVGAFAHGMSELSQNGLDAVLRSVADKGTPLLGICLGMQMLLDESEEFGLTRGLGLIPGRVVAIPPIDRSGLRQKVPHIGWNALTATEQSNDWAGSLLQDIDVGESVYFVHSFMASPKNHLHRIADCLYGDIPISAVIGRANVVGCQFHPEKSGEVGLKVLRRFLMA
jgi:glutamine amidotransferase